MFKISIGLILVNLVFMSVNGMSGTSPSTSSSTTPSSTLDSAGPRSISDCIRGTSASIRSKFVMGTEVVVDQMASHSKVSGVTAGVLTTATMGLILKRAEIDDRLFGAAVAVSVGAIAGGATWAACDSHSRTQRRKKLQQEVAVAAAELKTLVDVYKGIETRLDTILEKQVLANGVFATNTAGIEAAAQDLVGTRASLAAEKRALADGKTAIDSKASGLKADFERAKAAIAVCEETQTRIDDKLAQTKKLSAANLGTVKALAGDSPIIASTTASRRGGGGGGGGAAASHAGNGARISGGTSGVIIPLYRFDHR